MNVITPIPANAISIGTGPDEIDLRFSGWWATIYLYDGEHDHLVLRVSWSLPKPGMSYAYDSGAAHFGCLGCSHLPACSDWRISSLRYASDGQLHSIIDEQAGMRIDCRWFAVFREYEYTEERHHRSLFGLSYTIPSLYNSSPEACRAAGHPTPDKLNDVLYA